MKYCSIVAAVLFIAACGEQVQLDKSAPVSSVEHSTILEQVDDLNAQLQESASSLKLIASLDHHRMAKEEGVYTPPAIASIWSDPAINTDLIAKYGQHLGLDLPFKFLCYSESDTTEAKLVFTSADFMVRRYGLAEEDLVDFASRVSSVVSELNVPTAAVELDSVTPGFGMIMIQSDFDFDTTVANLRAIVDAQSDTRWFGKIDYQKEALQFGDTIGPTTLLLFGGPAPGGKAMMTSPRIGLDAFCQKLLVFENSDEEVYIAFNEIVAFAKLYYGEYTKPQTMIDQRLTATFTKAIKRN